MARGLVRALLFGCLVALAACEAPQTPTTAPRGPDDGLLPPEVAVENFIQVARAMEPKIEAECRARSAGRNCDYQIMVDDRPSSSPNAFQTVDKQGRPIVAFNIALIAEAQNRDELAFVMGHEAAHHIAGHITAKTEDALRGAVFMGVLAAAAGADPGGISRAQNIGADLGSRAYAKDYELEADRLGTVITWDAGFDPLRGAQFFRRIPDPGDTFLGTHPANALRMDVVAATVASLRAGSS